MAAAGMIYIAHSFKTVARSASQRGKWPVDNDPHFWNSPPTWGICRPDLRRKAKSNQTIFFVLPKRGHHTQMIFGYLTIDKVITHLAAFRLLPQKRMRGASPDGNIIVGQAGRYNRWDEWAHEHNFSKIKKHYAIGKPKESRFLTPAQIELKAPEFITTLRNILGGTGDRAIDHITRAGRQSLTHEQVNLLKRWVDRELPAADRGIEELEPNQMRARVRLSSCISSSCKPKIRRAGC